MKESISYYFYRRAASSVHITKLIPALERGENSLRELSKNIGMTYTNITNVMQDAHREGYIDRKMTKNTWTFTITDKGRALCALCRGLKAVVENWNGQETIDYLNNIKFGKKTKELKK